MQKFFFARNFFREGRPRLVYGRLLVRFTVYRLAKFGWVALLISVCEAWKRSGMQYLRRVGENSPQIWRYLWTKVNVVLRRCRRLLVVCNALVRLCIYHVSFRRYRPLKLPLICEIDEKGSFRAPDLQEKGYPRFRTCIFKLHLLPTMWLDMVEFRSASSKIRGRKKKERKKKQSVVKHKSTDMYVGRPNKSRLDKFWIFEGDKCYYTAELAGAGLYRFQKLLRGCSSYRKLPMATVDSSLKPWRNL